MVTPKNENLITVLDSEIIDQDVLDDFTVELDLEDEGQTEMSKSQHPSQLADIEKGINEQFDNLSQTFSINSRRSLSTLSHSLDWTEIEQYIPSIRRDNLEQSNAVMSPLEFQSRMANLLIIPDMSTISLDTHRISRLTKSLSGKEDEAPERDLGTFVDPLTGEVLSDMAIEKEEIIMEEAQSEESVEMSAESSHELFIQFSEDEEILQFVEGRAVEENKMFEMEVPVAEEEIYEKNMDEFLEEIEHMPGDEIEKRSFDARKQAMKKEMLRVLIESFLNSLIGQVVHRIEYVDPVAEMRKNLDKKKMVDKIYGLWLNLRLEQRISLILHRKIIDYFRHKKIFRYLIENVARIRDDKEKYHENIEYLDLMLGYEKHAEDHKIQIESDLENKLYEIKTLVQNEIEKLETMVRGTFSRADASERYISVINSLLRRMRHQRNEITEIRRGLILKQSTVAHLTSQIQKLESLGEGLSLNDYNDKLTEAIGFAKLLEEKDFMTGYMRKRCHDALHTVTHMVENISMQKSMLALQKEELAAVDKRKIDLREKLHTLKIKHISLQREHMQLNYKGGLTGNQSILRDYDSINDRLLVVRERVTKLRAEQERLSKKFEFLKKYCESFS